MAPATKDDNQVDGSGSGSPEAQDSPTTASSRPIRNAQQQYGDTEASNADHSYQQHRQQQQQQQLTDASVAQQTDQSNSAQSAPARAWQTFTATLQVYRTEIASRLSKSSIRTGKQRRRDSDGQPSSSQRSTRTAGSQSDGSWKAEIKRILSLPAVRAALFTLLALIALLLVLIGVESTHLFTSTLSSPTQSAQDRILNEALILKGPDSVRLLNISDEGIQVRIDGRLGLDPDRALDIWLGERKSEGWWKRKDRDIVEWALAKVGGVKVEVGKLTVAEPDWKVNVEETELHLIPEKGDKDGQQKHSSISSIYSPSASQSPQDLLTFNMDPLFVPFPGLLKGSKGKHFGGEDDDPVLGGNGSRRAHLMLRPLNLTILFKPVTPASYLVELGQRASQSGNVTLDIKVDSLKVKGITKAEMASGRPTRGWNVPGLISLGQSNIRKRFRQIVPKSGLGDSADGFLNLTRYDFFEIDTGKSSDGDVKTEGTKSLGITAYAQAKNPLGNLLRGSVKYSLPFGIFLPVSQDSNLTDSAAPLKKDKDDENAPLDTVLLAAVASQPFEIDGSDQLDLIVSGRVVPPPPPPQAPESLQQLKGQAAFTAPTEDHSPVAIKDTPQELALSNFLSRFLRGENNTVYVRGGSPFEPGSPEADPSLPGLGSTDLPDWLSSALTILDLPISFPGSKVTDLIRNVSIADLQIRPHPFSTDKLLFSGTIMGELVMPGQLAAVDVQIRYLWPDILVYDGKPPGMKHPGGGDDDDGGLPDDGGDDDDDDDDLAAISEAYQALKRSDLKDASLESRKGKAGDDDGDGDDPEEPAPPLPDPLPPKAFGRVRPHHWANATTFIDPSDPAKQRKLLRSELKDVPFSVLPGRGSEFRSFTWRLITSSEGVEAGIEGSSRVKIWNSGLGDLEIKQLPVSGAFIVGGRNKD